MLPTMHTRGYALGATLLLMISSIGCAESNQNRADVARSPQDVDRVADELERAVVTRVQERASALATEPVPLERLWQLPLHHAALVEALYAERSPAFVAGTSLSPRGQAVLDALAACSDEGLYPDDYHVAELRGRLEPPTDSASAPLPALGPAQREQLRSWLQQRPVASFEADLDALFNPATSPLPELASNVAAAEAHAREQRIAAAEAEWLIADGVLAYAAELRYRRLWDLAPGVRLAEGDERLLRERLVDFFAQLVSAEDDAVAPLLASLAPSDARYVALRQALVKYRAIVAAGGWPELDPASLPINKSSPAAVVQLLRQRLAAEGFLTAPAEGAFDADLRRALVDYQLTHQLKDDGVVEEADLNSLNRSAHYRLAQIQTTMERLRDTRVGNEDYYVYVNIPDFHGEVWRDGALQHRFRVITGSPARYFSEEREDYWYLNATPLISAEIQTLIFNPYWNVPPRIMRELELKAAEEPDYYEKNNFEVSRSGGKVTRVRQKPGGDNALGQVKFIFPNPYDVYMHDTPNKRAFKHEIRAFSHGCVRVHEPLKLAEVLLGNDGRPYPKLRVKQYLAGGSQDGTELDHKIPIHIEYNVVRVADDGRVHFGADPYRYDAPRVHELMARNGVTTDEDEPALDLKASGGP